MYYNGQYGGQFPPMPPQYYRPPEEWVPYEEKRRIRKLYNSIGLVLLSLTLLMDIISGVSYELLEFFGNKAAYNGDGSRIINFWEAIVSGCFPALIAITVFAAYCLITRYDPSEIFRTERLKGKEVAGYVFAVLFMQQISLIISMIMMVSLDVFGLTVPSVDYVLDHTPEVYLADLLSTVLLAPIAEELIYRGIVLRCAAKVSRRFAIFFSAFIFGIMHGNPYQFVLGFLIGVPMAMITIKTGSVVPAIICHMSNNLVAAAGTAAEYFNEDIANIIPWACMPVLLTIGLIIIISAAVKGKITLPEYTSYHRKRTLPIMITSWSMIAVMIIYVFSLLLSISAKAG